MCCKITIYESLAELKLGQFDQYTVYHPCMSLGTVQYFPNPLFLTL